MRYDISGMLEANHSLYQQCIWRKMPKQMGETSNNSNSKDIILSKGKKI